MKLLPPSKSEMFGSLPSGEFPRCVDSPSPRWLTHLPQSAKRFALEVMGCCAIGFLLNFLLLSQTSDLKDFRAYFLLAGRDQAVLGIAAYAGYRALRHRK